MTAHADLPPTTALADVLALREEDGWLSPPLRGYVGGPGVLGSAATVTLGEGLGGFAPLHELLSGDLHGQVVVVTSPRDDIAVWGELLTAAAAGRGALAVLVAGGLRDVAGCRRLGLPVWARAVATAGPAGSFEVVAVGEPVTVGTATVADGELVLVDEDGVVALPAEGAEDLLDDARAYAAAEERVAAELAAGLPLREAYRHKADAVAAITARR